MFMEVIRREEVVRKLQKEGITGTKTGMSSIKGGHKGFILVIKIVTFNSPLFFFPVNFKGKRERRCRFLLCFISHFGPATTNNTDSST